MRRQTWENTQDEILVCRKAYKEVAIARGDIATEMSSLFSGFASHVSPINYSILTKHSPPLPTCLERRHACHRPWEKGMWICSVSNHERTSHRHASNRKRPQIHCPQDLHLLLSHDLSGKIWHLTISLGDICFSPLVPCPLAQNPGKPSFCDLPLGVHMRLGQLRGARRLTHSPQFCWMRPKAQLPSAYLSQPSWRRELLLRFFNRNRWKKNQRRIDT